eukprot:TRINITY_DN76542_c0_g1_i1.p1 TRINITY_DN76542_c0_g1~~TRINITY_DN76542_c0_g1_i1.p1  ORF type:complete len:427 (-),score=56.77 TRINITY_DN76542_c0_g1_i1:74-1225(-)
MTDIGSRNVFDSDHDTFRASVRRFFEERVVPFHKEWEKQGFCPRSLWKEAGENGFLGVAMPEEYGGAGTDILYSSVIWEEQSYAGASGPGFHLHSEIVMPYLLNYGSEEQKKNYLPKLASGDCIGAIAMTEPSAGSDLQGIKTNAVRKDGQWVINGSKTYITNGGNSDLAIVVAKTGDKGTKVAHGISLFLVDTNLPGFTKGNLLQKLGMKAQDTCELFFDNVTVPDSALLGEENKGFYYLMNELPQERLLIAGMAISACEAMYEWTREFVKDRKAFGRTIADLQTVKHRMADMKMQIAAGRSFYDDCLLRHNEGKLDSATASMAKAWLTDLQCKVADEGVQLHGGAGYMWEYPICRAYADARVQRIYGGSNEIMKELIARTI